MLEHLPKLGFRDSGNFFLIAGPCVVESKELCFEVAEQVKAICDRLSIPYIFKASYRKANRSKGGSFKGIGDELALSILQEVGERLNLPITTDIHETHEAVIAAEVVDILQIPAFLCRQTDLLEAAAETGKYVNIKKGQFAGVEAMRYAKEKVEAAGNSNTILTERGSTFGYNDLVVDFRSLPLMQALGSPVVLDCTHCLQQPNLPSGISGGNPMLIGTMAKAGIAVGANGLFIETHPRPQEALSDGQSMLPLKELESLLEQLVTLRQAIRHTL